MQKQKKRASIKIKVNSLSDRHLIEKLYEAAHAGVDIKLIVRGICCAVTDSSKFKTPIKAISIVDEYLEHARVMIFENGGKGKYYISSADWMVRNLDHRIEATLPVTNKAIRKELRDIIDIQLNDNIKARLLDNKLSNDYVQRGGHKKVRSQIEIYKYLCKKQFEKEEKNVKLSKKSLEEMEELTIDGLNSGLI